MIAGSHGAVQLLDGEILFTPDHNFDGRAWFDYKVTDDTDGIDTGRVFVDVALTNRATPLLLWRTPLSVSKTSRFIVTVQDLIGNDYDPDGDEFQFVRIVQDGVDGNAYLLPDGRWALTPEGDFNGVATFTYTVTDGRLGTTTQNSISVDFSPVNDAPMARSDSGYQTQEDTPIEIDLADLLANDTDTEHDQLTVVGVLDPVNGSVAIVGNKAVFTPRADYFGNGGFSYRISDGNGGFAVGTVTLWVEPRSGTAGRGE